MVLSSGVRRQPWIHRLVYFPDEDLYDLIPEQRLPWRQVLVEHGQRFMWPQDPTMYQLAGVVVQPLYFDQRTGDDKTDDDWGGGMYSAVRGVKVVQVLRSGDMSWWTVNKRDVEGVGVEGIVL